MKKVLSFISMVLVMFGVSASANAENYFYSSNGNMINSSYAGSVQSPGAVVVIDGNIFTHNIKTETTYSVYSNESNNETLTLGILNSSSGKTDDKTRLQTCVSDQIKYIESVGGVMTGYSIVPDINQTGRNALNISWDIGSEEHHFARFELDTGASNAVGYYDVLYRSKGSAQYLIADMNNSMYVKYGSSAVETVSKGWYVASTGDYTFYGVEIISISQSTVTFKVTEASGAACIVHETDITTASINNQMTEFNWKDSWGVSGRGKMIFHANYIEIEMIADNWDVSYYRGGSLEGKYDLYYKSGDPFGDFEEKMSREMMSY